MHYYRNYTGGGGHLRGHVFAEGERGAGGVLGGGGGNPVSGVSPVTVQTPQPKASQQKGKPEQEIVDSAKCQAGTVASRVKQEGDEDIPTYSSSGIQNGTLFGQGLEFLARMGPA